MARFSVVIAAVTEKKKNSIFVIVSLVAAKNSHQKLKHDIKRVTV